MTPGDRQLLRYTAILVTLIWIAVFVNVVTTLHK